MVVLAVSAFSLALLAHLFFGGVLLVAGEIAFSAKCRKGLFSSSLACVRRVRCRLHVGCRLRDLFRSVLWKVPGADFRAVRDWNGVLPILRNFRDPLDIDVTLGSESGESAQFDLDVPQGSSFDPEDWRRGVASYLGGWYSPQQHTANQLNLWVSAVTHFVTPRYGTELPRSVAEDSAVTADRSVRGAFSVDELEEAVQLATAQTADSDAGMRVPILNVD